MTNRRWTRWSVAWFTGIAALAMVVLLGGCQTPLFPADAPRSPYDRYRTLRGDERPMTDEMARGTARSGRPALRDRLRPLDQY